MKIREYMEKHNLSHRKFAKEVGVSPSTIFHFLSGRNKSLSTKTIEKIIKGTKKQVTLQHLMEEIAEEH